MATLTEILGAEPTGPTDVVGSIDKGIKTGIQLATAQDQIEEQKTQAAQLKQQLQQSQMNGIANRMKAAAYAPPAQRKILLANLKSYADSIKTPVDVDAFAATLDDEQSALAVRQGLSKVTKGEIPPESFLSTIASAGPLFDQVNELAHSNAQTQNKYQQAVEVAKARNEGMQQAAETRAAATVKAAELRGATSNDRIQGQASSRYTQNLKTAEQGLIAAHRALDIVDKVDSGELQANKALRADLTGTLASLVGGGKPSTVYGQQHQEFDSAYQNVKDKLNYLQGDAKNTLPPAQLKQLRLDVKALQDLYGEQHRITYEGFRASEPDSVQPKLDQRYNTIRENYGLSKLGESKAAPKPTAQAAPKFDKESFVKAAQAAGKSEAEIAAYLASKGVK